MTHPDDRGPASTCVAAPRRRHLQRAAAQRRARLAQGRSPARTSAASSPTPAACPRASTCRPWTPCCSSTRATRVVDVVQSVGRVMRRRRGQELRLHHPADRHPGRHAARGGAAGQQEVQGRLAGPAGAARARRPLQRHGQQDRAEQEPRRQSISVIGVPGGHGERATATAQQPHSAARLRLPATWRSGATRSTPRSSRRAATAATGRTGPSDIAEIAERHITRIRALLDDPTSEGSTGLRRLPRRAARQPQRRHRPRRRHRDARPAPHHPAGVRRAVRGLRLRRAQPRLAGDAADARRARRRRRSDKETETLENFYDSVRMRASGIDTAEGRQRIITELYEKFFQNAFPKMADRLGIVYTPIEIVDFILHSRRATCCASTSDSSLGATGRPRPRPVHRHRHLHRPPAAVRPDRRRRPGAQVHRRAARQRDRAARLLHRRDQHRSGLPPPARRRVRAVPGHRAHRHLPDGRDGDEIDALMFPENNERVDRQKAAGHPRDRRQPALLRRAGQPNDNNQNLKYPTLDERIDDTYAERSTATIKNNLYDSYIRAIRWASDRIGDAGVVAFVTNGGFIDGTPPTACARAWPTSSATSTPQPARQPARRAGRRLAPGGRQDLRRRQPSAGRHHAARQDAPPTGQRSFATTTSATTSPATTSWHAWSTSRASRASRGRTSSPTPTATGSTSATPHSTICSYSVTRANSLSRACSSTYALGLSTNRDAWVYSFDEDATPQERSRDSHGLQRPGGRLRQARQAPLGDQG